MDTVKRHGRRWLGILLSVAMLVTMVVVASVTATGANFTQSQTITGIAPVDIPQITFMAPETIWLQTATSQTGTTRTIDRVSNILPGFQVGAENDARLLFSSPDSRVRLVSIINNDLQQATNLPSSAMFNYSPGTGTNNHNVVANMNGQQFTSLIASLASMGTRLTTWTATYEIDGFPGQFVAQAYSIVWAPSTYMAGSVGAIDGAGQIHTAIGVLGIHSDLFNSGNRNATHTFFNDIRTTTASDPGNSTMWFRDNYLSPGGNHGNHGNHFYAGVLDGNVIFGRQNQNLSNGANLAFGFTSRLHVGNMVIDTRMDGQDIPGFALTYFKGHRIGGGAVRLAFGQGFAGDHGGFTHAQLVARGDRFGGAYGMMNHPDSVSNPNMGGVDSRVEGTIQFNTSRLWREGNPAAPLNALLTQGNVVPFSAWHWVRLDGGTHSYESRNAAIAHNLQIGVNWIDKTALRNQVVAASTQLPARPATGPWAAAQFQIADAATVNAHRLALQAATEALGTPNSTTTLVPSIPGIVAQGTNVTATVQYMIRLPGGALRPATATEVNFTDFRAPGLANNEARITVPAGVGNNVTIAPLNLGSGFQLSGIIALGAGATSPAIPANLAGFSWSDTLTANATYILVYDAVDYLPTFTIELEQAGDDVGGDTDLTVMDTDLFTSLVDTGALDIPSGQQLMGWETEVNGATDFIPYDTDLTIGQVLAMVSHAAGGDGVITFNAVVALPGDVIIVYRPNCTGVLAHGDFVRGEVPAINSGTQGEDYTTSTPAATFVRPGHHFLGWSRLPVANAANPVIPAGEDLELAENEAAIVNLFDQWAPMDFELVFAGVSHIYNVGQTIAVAAPTVPTGQQFLGWACVSAPGVVIWPAAPATMPNLQLAIAGLTVMSGGAADDFDFTAALTAVFATNEYQVMFLDAYGLTGMQVVLLANPITGVLHGATLATGDVLADPVDPTGAREFRGWSTTRVDEADATAVLVDPATAAITNHTRFYAVWDYAAFTVTWQYNGTVVRTDNDVAAGDVLTPPLVGPTGEQYAPDWWSVAGEGTLIFDGANLRFLAGAGNATLSATSGDETPAPLRITINPNGGTMASGQTAPLTLAALPGGSVNLDVTLRGRTLVGWMNGTTDLGPITTFEVNEDNLTLIAQWNDDENIATATRVFPSFFIMDENGAEVELEYGVDLPADGFAFDFPFGAGFPTEAGGNDQWSFVNWVGQDGSIVTSTCDVNFVTGEEIRAFYVRNFQVMFDPNDGEFTTTTDATITRWVTYGTIYGDMPEVQRENWIFVGWYDTADETGGTRYQANSLVENLSGGAVRQFAGGTWEVPNLTPAQDTTNAVDQVLFARWVRVHECEPCGCDVCQCDEGDRGPCGNLIGGPCQCDEGDRGPCGNLIGGPCQCEEGDRGPCGNLIGDGCDCCTCPENCNCEVAGCGDDCDCENGGRPWWQVLLAILGGVAIGVMIPLLMFLGGRAMGHIFCWFLFGC